MELYTFIVVYGMFCPWLIFFSIMFYMALCFDRSFIFIIFNKNQLRYYLCVFSVMLAFPFYVFAVRIHRIGLSLDLLWLKEVIITWIGEQTEIFLFQIIIIVIICIIFSFLTMKWLQLQFRKYALALYLYYWQYHLFIIYIRKILGLRTSFRSYVFVRVKLITKNDSIVRIAYNIWPTFFFTLTGKILRVILPYVIIFDYITQNGVLTKMFVVLPLCYIYYLRKTVLNLFHKFVNEKFIEFSNTVYKSSEFNGEIHRWVSIPENLPSNWIIMSEKEDPKSAGFFSSIKQKLKWKKETKAL